MADKDLNEKLLEDYNDVFADIYNTLVFGTSFLEEGKLESGSTESIYKAEHGEAKNQFRDVYKKYKENCLSICSLGIENQTESDDEMPVRIMGYDYGSYRQMLKNDSVLYPVTTIVLNFGNQKWSSAKSLHEMMRLPEELKPYIEDYKIRVYDIAFLSDNVIEKFTSDFKVIAKFFKQRRMGCHHKLLEEKTPIRHVEAILDFLTVFTKDNQYRIQYHEHIKAMKEKGEEVCMCEVVDYFIEKGISRGMSQGLKALIDTMRPYISDVAQLHKMIVQNEIYADVTEEEVRSLYEN